MSDDSFFVALPTNRFFWIMNFDTIPSHLVSRDEEPGDSRHQQPPQVEVHPREIERCLRRQLVATEPNEKLDKDKTGVFPSGRMPFFPDQL